MLLLQADLFSKTGYFAVKSELRSGSAPLEFRFGYQISLDFTNFPQSLSGNPGLIRLIRPTPLPIIPYSCQFIIH
jgi:hypothetical protein